MPILSRKLQERKQEKQRHKGNDNSGMNTRRVAGGLNEKMTMLCNEKECKRVQKGKGHKEKMQGKKHSQI